MFLYKWFLFEVFILAVIGWAALFQKGQYFVPIIVGLIARLFLILIHEYSNLFGDADISDYEKHFSSFAYSLKRGKLYWGFHVAAYTLLYPGWIYAWLGPEGMWLIRVANAAVSMFVLGPLVHLYRMVFGKSMPIKVLFLVSFWPSWLRYSIEVGRSAAVAFFVLIALRYLVEVVIAFSPKALLLSGIFTVYALFLRVHHVGYFAPVFVYYFILKLKNVSDKYLKIIILPLIFVLMILAGMSSVRLYRVFVSGNRFDINSVQQMIWFTQNREGGGSAYLEGVYPSSSIDFLWYFPLQAFYFMFSPMPWDADKPFVVGSSLQAWILLIMILMSLRNHWKMYTSNTALKILLLSFLFVAFGFGAVSKNAGAAERQRMPITITLLCLVPSLTRRFGEGGPAVYGLISQEV